MPDESLLIFPCEFPIKIVGVAGDDFEITTLSIIRTHFPDLKQDALKIRPSKNGKYMAITVTVIANNQGQLDAAYEELSAHPSILIVL